MLASKLKEIFILLFIKLYKNISLPKIDQVKELKYLSNGVECICKLNKR